VQLLINRIPEADSTTQKNSTAAVIKR